MNRALEPFAHESGHLRRVLGAAGTALAVAAGVLTASALPASAAPVGQVHEYGAMSALGSSPQGIAKGPDGNMWFTEYGANKIGRITSAGVVTEFVALTGTSATSIAAGPDGNMWFTEPNANRVGTITTSGAVTEYTIGLSPSSAPFQIAAGPEGNMWFTESSGSRIGRITMTGTITQFSTGITAHSSPYGIARGSDGNMWFTESVGNKIGRITMAGAIHEFSTGITAGSGMRGIAAGPDGNLWFAELEAQQVARITTAGVVTEFSTGITGNANPIGIAAGAGAMWFTEGLGNRVARIGTDPSMTCKVKGGINKPKLKVICHIKAVKPSANVKWKVKRHGHLVAKDHKKLKSGKLVINLSHVAVHKGKNKVTVTVGKGTRTFVLHQTVKIHKK